MLGVWIMMKLKFTYFFVLVISFSGFLNTSLAKTLHKEKSELRSLRSVTVFFSPDDNVRE